MPSFRLKTAVSAGDRASASGAGRELVPEPTHSRHSGSAAGVSQIPGMGCTPREMGYEFDLPIPVGDDESVADQVVWRGVVPKAHRPNPCNPFLGWRARASSIEAGMEYALIYGPHSLTHKPTTIGESLESARAKGELGVLVFDKTLTVVAMYRA